MYNKKYPHTDSSIVTSDTTVHDTTYMPQYVPYRVKGDSIFHEGPIRLLTKTITIRKDSITYRCDSSQIVYLKNVISISQDSIRNQVDKINDIKQQTEEQKSAKKSFLIWAIIATITSLLFLYLCIKKWD